MAPAEGKANRMTIAANRTDCDAKRRCSSLKRHRPLSLVRKRRRGNCFIMRVMLEQRAV